MTKPGKAVVHCSTAYDFLASLTRIENNDDFTSGQDADRHLSEWARQAAERMPAAIRESLSVFFSRETGYGITLAGQIAEAGAESAESFLSHVSAMSPQDILVPFIYAGIGPRRDISREDVESVAGNDKMAVAFINENLTFTPREKWQMLQFLLDPAGMKRELLALLHWHYDNLYAAMEPEIRALVASRCQELKNRIDKFGDEYVKLLLPLDYSRRRDATLTLAVSHFWESGSTFLILSDLLICGSAYLEEMADLHAIVAGSKIFKTLADETRLQILRLLAEKPCYGHELATRLNLSNSTISHHVSLLSIQGLIRAYREENKVYFSLDPAEFLDSVAGAARRVISDD